MNRRTAWKAFLAEAAADRTLSVDPAGTGSLAGSSDGATMTRGTTGRSPAGMLNP